MLCPFIFLETGYEEHNKLRMTVMIPKEIITPEEAIYFINAELDRKEDIWLGRMINV